jgi:hypothetical protein
MNLKPPSLRSWELDIENNRRYGEFIATSIRAGA